MNRILLVAWFFLVFGPVALRAAPETWDGPAATLAAKIADAMGPGQARLTLDNRSTIEEGDVAVIRGLFEQHLKSHGISVSGVESATSLHITLSENARGRLWVAEVVQGSQTQVMMVSLSASRRVQKLNSGGLALVSESVLTTNEPVLAMIESGSGWVALEPDQLVYFVRDGNGWSASGRSAIATRRAMTRDFRGVIEAASGGFAAWLPGATCSGQTDSVAGAGSLIAQCLTSDDPWPVAAAVNATEVTQLKAFYNARRNFFTGVVTPNVGADLPAFYSAALVPRAVGGAALLIGGIDGKVQIVENNMLKPVSGTRDWGSDFVVVNSGCGTGVQVIASSSGDGANDSLRAYELPAMEAVAVSAPLATGGPVVALWTTPDGKSAFATVKHGADQFEVDRVSARCN